MAPPGLSFHIAEKQFGADAVLFQNFSLEVQPGEVLAVLGPSGIGKSTLLRLIAGIDCGFSGSISVGGIDAGRAAAPGFVFQDARLLPWMTARDNVRLADPQLGVGDADALLSLVGLKGQGDAFPLALSGGMQRRVALARSMASTSGLLLLDEPFVSLDAALAREMRALLASLVSTGALTMVLVTHDAEDAAQLADRAIVLAGRPAAVVADLRFDVPRSARTMSDIAEYRAMLKTKEPASS